MPKINILDPDFELEEPAEKLPWVMALAALLGLFAFLPLTEGLGLSELMQAGRSYAPGSTRDTFLYFLLYFGGVHMFLILPLSTLVFPQLILQQRRAFQLLVPLLLLTPPLISFAYWTGDIKDLLGLHEVALAVIPAAAISIWLYLRTRNALFSSAFLAIATFIPLFVVNDLLSAFPILFAYASNGASFYFWRTLVPLVTLFVVLQTSKERVPEPALENLAVACLGLGIYTLTLHFALPAVLAMGEPGEAAMFFRRDLGTLVFLATGYFLWRPSRFGYWALLAVAVVEGLIAIGWLAWYANHLKFSFWEMARVTHLTCAGALAVGVLWALSRASTRERFGITLPESRRTRSDFPRRSRNL